MTASTRSEGPMAIRGLLRHIIDDLRGFGRNCIRAVHRVAGKLRGGGPRRAHST